MIIFVLPNQINLPKITMMCLIWQIIIFLLYTFNDHFILWTLLLKI